MQPLNPISSIETPRDILSADFKSLSGRLPISGGWGYTQADACIIDKNDPLVDPLRPFDLVGFEYIFVEKRIYEEMIIFRPDGEQFSGIEWNLLEQESLDDGGRRFDRLNFEITAFLDSDWQELKSDFEGPQGYGHPDFDLEGHGKKRSEKMLRFTREFWFDVTTFVGQELVPIEDTARATVSNSDLIDPDQGVFSVLGLVALRLDAKYCWQGEDIDDVMAKGAAFHAWVPEDAKEGALAIATITVVDASNDPTEPDVSTLEKGAVPGLDALLQESVRSRLAADGRELIQWMSSALNEFGNLKGLVTAYIVNDQGKQQQNIVFRIKAKDRKIVAIGAFDIAKKQCLAEPIINAIRTMVLLT